LQRKIITTADGSKTIHIVDWNEQYHSKHGAILEAYHVFIKHGLSLFKNENVSILEIGFGTGLNCLITLLESKKLELSISYTGIEAFPVSENEVSQLNYLQELNALHLEKDFAVMHNSPWGKNSTISNDFSLLKRKQDFLEIDDEGLYNLIYFDAFGARVQPELWSISIFQKMYTALKSNGILVTYSAKGSVRRAMQEAGFTVERLPGPPGKREMLRATKQE